MHLATYLGMMHRSAFDLANGFRVVADGHAEEPDVYHICQTLAKQCEEHAEKLKPFVDRYGEEKPEEPDRLYHELFDEARQGARDRELLEVVETCEGQTATQIKWLKTRMKQAAPRFFWRRPDARGHGPSPSVPRPTPWYC